MKTSHLVVALVLASCGVSSDDSMYLTGTEQEPLTNAAGQPTCAGKKVLICHIPPGNPANAHTICVGQPAVEPHQRLHGDGVGACGTTTPPPSADAGSQPPPPPPNPPACVAVNGACNSSADCCAPNECRLGVCSPPVQ